MCEIRKYSALRIFRAIFGGQVIWLAVKQMHLFWLDFWCCHFDWWNFTTLYIAHTNKVAFNGRDWGWGRSPFTFWHKIAIFVRWSSDQDKNGLNITSFSPYFKISKNRQTLKANPFALTDFNSLKNVNFGQWRCHRSYIRCWYVQASNFGEKNVVSCVERVEIEIEI